MKIQYTKAPLSFQEQILLLKQRGLIISNEQKAEKILATISYYRFSAYLYPFRDQNNSFLPNSSFNDAFLLYKLDSELRKFILGAIEQFEISLRTALIYHVSHDQKSGFWLENFKMFENFGIHLNILNKTINQLGRSNEKFIKHFQEKYDDPVPPAWMTLEIISFTSLSIIYKNLKNKDLKNKISKKFSIKYPVFESWLEAMVVTRNACAHHSRLYNKSLYKIPKWPKLKDNWIDTWIRREENPNNSSIKIYCIISILKYSLDIINPQNSINDELRGLLNKYEKCQPEKLLGFPSNWKEQKLWTT